MPGGHASHKSTSIKPNTNSSGALYEASDDNLNPEDILEEEVLLNTTHTEPLVDVSHALERPDDKVQADDRAMDMAEAPAIETDDQQTEEPPIPGTPLAPQSEIERAPATVAAPDMAEESSQKEEPMIPGQPLAPQSEIERPPAMTTNQQESAPAPMEAAQAPKAPKSPTPSPSDSVNPPRRSAFAGFLITLLAILLGFYLLNNLLDALF